jgi:2-polyprenyl-6-methoxyphenol hydroxylase-like FAD-dependent oxidoreductase
MKAGIRFEVNGSSIHEIDVLIVGAGPTGLVLALWLTRRGVRVKIVDKTAEPGTTSRALAVQARTLELYRQIGLANAVVEGGWRVFSGNLWVAGKRVAHFDFGDMGAGISQFPQPVIFPQDQHERLLVERLSALGVGVERRTEFVGFEDSATHVKARLKRPDGSEEICEAAYLAGCDGAHSAVRETLKIGFPGGLYNHLFYVADVEASGVVMNGEIHVDFDPSDFLAVFPLKGRDRARLIGTVSADAEHWHENLSWDDVSRHIIERMRINVERVNWFSTYRVHHRVADHFAKGRAFLLGDAAHIHSPVGGQGMNTGIGDAVNLAWKLVDVMHRRASTSLLDSYEPERIGFARRLVATTDRAFTGVTSSGSIARRLRMNIAPRVVPLLFKLPPFRRFVFRTISQTAVNYRGSSLSEGHAGSVYGGDRLPWVRSDVNNDAADNFRSLTSLDWQVHVYGDPAAELQPLCDSRKLSLYVFPWRSEMGRTGIKRNAIYLVRPDGYVALADQEGHATAISAYLDARRLTLTR